MNMLQRVLAKAKTITDDALFTSKQFEKYIALLVMGMCSRFKNPPKICLYCGSPDETACTDNKEIRVNIFSKLIAFTDGRESTREEKTRGIKGTIAHEVAHIIYTDFKLANTVYREFRNNRTLYPIDGYLDYVENADELLSYFPSQKGDMIYKIYDSSFNNVLEDAYVDDQITGGRYPLGKDRQFILKKFVQDFPTFESLLEKEASCKELGELNLALGLLFAYGKLHIIPKHEKKNENHPALQKLYQVAPEIDAVLGDDDSLVRVTRIQKIMCLYWPEIKAYLDTIPDDEAGQAEQPSNGAEKDNSAPTGDGGTGNSQNGSIGKRQTNVQQNAIRQMLSGKPGDEKKDGSDSSANGSEGKNNDGANQDGSLESNGGQNGQTQQSSGSSAGGCQNDTPSDSDGDEQLSSSIKGMLKSMAEEEVDKEDAEASIQAFRSSKAAGSFKMSVNFNHEPDEGRYDMIKETAETTSKALVKYFRQRIQAKNGYKMSGFYSGTKISMSAIASNNQALFEKKKLPGDIPKVSVAYLGDESGSMRGRKQKVNMLTAETIYTFCDALNIPVGVYGHSYETGSDRMRLNIYSDFRKSKRDKFRITEIGAGHCNLDGYAIRLVAEKLLQQPSEYHVMIITSDGLPSAYDTLEDGIEDIKAAVRECSRKGICFIAAAMDEDKDAIQNIYGSAYLDVTDLDKMPKKLVNALAKYLA